MLNIPKAKKPRRGTSERLYRRGLTWWTWGYDVDGRKWLESTKQREKGAARLAAREIARRYASNPERARTSKITVEKAVEALISFLERARSPARVREVEYHGIHLCEILGPDKPIADIDLAATTDYAARRLSQAKQGVRVSKHTVKKEITALSQAWRRLAKIRLLPPCPDLMPDELAGAYEPRDRWLTQAEYVALRDALAPKKAGRKGGLRHHTQDRRDYLEAYVLTGARRAELFGYDRDRDLDQKRRLWHVRGTKTDAADRTIPLNDQAFALFARRQSFPVWHTIDRDLWRACERAGIPVVTANSLRHTFCSWMAQAGVPEQHTAKLMGHTDSVMVRRVYSHFDHAPLADAVARIAAPAPVAGPVAKRTPDRGVTGGKRRVRSKTKPQKSPAK